MGPRFLTLLVLSACTLTAATPPWKKELTSPNLGTFPALPPCTLDYKVSWKGMINAGNLRMEFAPAGVRKPGALVVRSSASSLGAASALFPFKSNFWSELHPSSLRPRFFHAVETDRKETVTTNTRHFSDRVVCTETTKNLKTGISIDSTHEFDFQPTFDIFSAMLHVRSQKLNAGDHITLVVHPFDNPYLLRVKVIGREAHLDRKTIRLSVGMRKIDRKSLTLVPYKKLKGDATLWLSDDADRVPVEFRAQVFIGDVRATLDQHEQTLMPHETHNSFSTDNMSTHSSPAPRSGQNTTTVFVALSVLWVTIILCVWPGMHAPLFTDDVHQLEKSSHFVKWTEIFNPDVFGFYRPVKNLLFMWAAPLSENLLAWHWIGLLAFLGSTIAVFRISSICLGSQRPALIATFLWALSPSVVSSILWVSCTNICIGVIFAAFLFHYHERWATRSTLGPAAACVVFYALALLCYESMIAIPGLLFLRDLQQRRLAFDRKTVVRYGTYTAVAIAFLIVRHTFSAQAIGDSQLHSGFAPDTKAIHLSLSAPWFLWRHFLMWIFPFGKLELLGSYGWMKSASVASLVFGGAFLATLLATAALAWKRCPAVAYGLLFFFVASVPAGNFVPNFNGPINDAYVTVPSIGLAIALAMCCELLIRKILELRRSGEPGAVVFVVVLVIFGLYRMPICGAYFRYWAGVWNRPVELMLLSAETRPFQFQPRAYSSVILLAEGYVDQAETIALETIQEAPWNPLSRLTLARIAVIRKDSKTAENHYQIILKSASPSNILRQNTQIELAEILAADATRNEETAGLLRQYLRGGANSRQPGAIRILAGIYSQQGNQPKALATLRRGLSIYPGDKPLEMMLASLEQGGPTSNAINQ